MPILKFVTAKVSLPCHKQHGGLVEMMSTPGDKLMSQLRAGYPPVAILLPGANIYFQLGADATPENTRSWKVQSP
jgi:hypothetical protein